jgi:hypothetical protein
MKIKTARFGALALTSTLATVALALLMATSPAQACGRNPNPGVLPVGSTPHGRTYAEWSAEWWKLGMEHPVDDNPLAEGGCFELSRSVWGLAAPLGLGVQHECTVPAGATLFVPTITVECSSLEPPESGFHGDTEAEQAECATFWADHIEDVSVEIDGTPVNDLTSYRFVSPQITFTAPTPWVFGSAGGPGTSVADGYYLMLAPLSKGEDTIRIRGAFHFAVAEGDPFDFDLLSDVTFHITVD